MSDRASLTHSETRCFHCQQMMPVSVPYAVHYQQQQYSVCCTGCQAVAQLILDSGLMAYYEQREVAPEKPQAEIPDHLLQELRLYDHDSVAEQHFVATDSGQEVILVIEGIVCAACVWLLERRLNRLQGVVHFHINYTTHRAQLIFDPKMVVLSDILLFIHQTGYRAYPLNEHQQQIALKKSRSILLMQFAVAAIFSMQVMMLSIALYFGDYEGMSFETRQVLKWANFLLAIPCITYASWPFYRSAYVDLKNRQLSMDVNISLAIILGSLASIYHTFTAGEIYFDSVTMFAFLLLGARLIEINARHKAIYAGDTLLRLKPALAWRAEGVEWVRIAVSHLKPEDKVMVKPGETIPADGYLLSQTALVDESLLSGESLPVQKKKGDSLIGGALNTDQSIEMQINKTGKDTVLSQMHQLIERAQFTKPKIAQLADHISVWFVGILLLLCFLTYIIWLYFKPDQAFTVMLSVLVVSCPCALALATPAALSAGQQRLLALGLISTREHVLEILPQITDVVFDKTGTLTTGQLTIKAIELVSSDVCQADVLAIAASLEARSEHPIARAFQAQNVTLLPVKNWHNRLGAGIEGEIEGQVYRLGALRQDVERLQGVEHLQGAENLSYEAQSWIELSQLFSDHWQTIAYFALHDPLKEDAPQLVEQLLTLGLNLHIVSGDQTQAVEHFRSLLNIHHVQGGTSPAGKLDYIQQLQATGRKVLMVGDGLNDAPVLAQADVSIAMAQGAQLSQANADMILLKDHLLPISEALQTAKFTRQIIYQNLAWALIYNIVALPLAMMGWIMPWMAALGMSMSSLIVIGNTLRLRE